MTGTDVQCPAGADGLVGAGPSRSTDGAKPASLAGFISHWTWSIPSSEALIDSSVVGLSPWSTTTLESPGRTPLEITATPCRHGPPLPRPVVGKVIGFAVGVAPDTVWISGDTVFHDDLRRTAERLTVDTAVLHLGGVR